MRSSRVNTYPISPVYIDTCFPIVEGEMRVMLMLGGLLKMFVLPDNAHSNAITFSFC